ENIPGYPSGCRRKSRSSDLDEAGRHGNRTRLIQITPGAYTTEPFVHDHWEEVFIYQGNLVFGRNMKGRGGEVYEAPTNAMWPGGVAHGPFASRTGCLMFETHYYEADG
ncbi:MAG: cupin, partial [Pseudomonadota bacterium]|nr:cupin [Pseudomonadota bacterium]